MGDEDQAASEAENVAGTVTVHDWNAGDNAEFEIPGLGLVINHQTKDVSQRRINIYESQGYIFPEDGALVIEHKEPDPDEAPEAPPGMTQMPGAPQSGDTGVDMTLLADQDVDGDGDQT